MCNSCHCRKLSWFNLIDKVIWVGQLHSLPPAGLHENSHRLSYSCQLFFNVSNLCDPTIRMMIFKFGLFFNLWVGLDAPLSQTPVNSVVYFVCHSCLVWHQDLAISPRVISKDQSTRWRASGICSATLVRILSQRKAAHGTYSTQVIWDAQ